MEGMEMKEKKLLLKVLSKKHCMPQAHNEKGQGGLEYLIIIGGVLILVAVSVAIMASIGETGTNSVNKGKGLFEEEIGKAEGPKANFETSIGDSGGPAPIEVEFTDTSTTPNGSIDSWSWNFGDGGTSTLSNPTHEFTQNIPYLVTLTVTDNEGGKSTAKKTISIDTYPIAAFDWLQLGGATVRTIRFVDDSIVTG
ncbi:PKD domain-containing protein, partial [Candidatus Micrarchaeota archaeon]|nr:PKD domain-containing protein [Candidatus Micrarchaeota archaeon]